MHMLKFQCLTAKLGKTAWNDISSMHMPDKAALGVLHTQIMAQELRTLNSKFVSSLRNNLFVSQVTCGDHVKWITDEKSRMDRSVSKGETMNTITLEI